jgi:hypothetical protein
VAAEVTLAFLGEQLNRLFGELRATRDELRVELRLSRDEITVLTGAFMRQDAEQAARERDRLAAAGLLAKQRRIDERLSVIEARLAVLEGQELA